MKNTTKRILAIVCAAMMILSLAIVPASAATDKVVTMTKTGDHGAWQAVRLSNTAQVPAETTGEFTTTIKFKVDSATGNGRPFGFQFNGKDLLSVSARTDGNSYIYMSDTLDWGGTVPIPSKCAHFTENPISIITHGTWIYAEVRSYLNDAGAIRYDVTINGAKVLEGYEGSTTLAAPAAAPGGNYLVYDAGFSWPAVGNHTMVWDFVKVVSGSVDYTNEFDDAVVASGASVPTQATDGTVWAPTATAIYETTATEDETGYESAGKDMILKVGRGSAGGNWDWAGLHSAAAAAATDLTEYTVTYRVKLENVTGNGRPFGFGTGNNQLVFTGSGDILKAQLTNHTNWGGTTAGGNGSVAVPVADVVAGEWNEFAVRSYLSGGAVLTDVSVNGNKVVTGATIDNGAGVLKPCVTNNNGTWYLFIDAGFSATSQQDWDLSIDYFGLDYAGAPESVKMEEFTGVTAAPGTAPVFANGKTWMNRMYENNRFDISVEEDVVEEEEEDDWVEPAIDKYLKFTKDTTHGSWGGVTLLTNRANNANVTVSEYTTSFRFMVENASAGSHAGRPFGFYVDGAGKDIFSISARSDGKVYIYMSDSMDWGGTVPIASKCAHFTADPIGTFAQGEWIDAEVRTYKTASGIRYDVKLNGTTVLTGYQGSTTLADPMPMKMGGYFAYTPGMAWNTHLFDLSLDYVKVEYEGSPEWMINEFKDAEGREGFLAPTLRNDNIWSWGAGNVYTTQVLDDLTGVNYTAALSGDANAFVQAFGEAAPHAAAANVAVPAMDAEMKVYAFAKAGYKVVGYKVDGGAVTPIIANDANLYVVPVTGDCAVQFVTEAIGATTPAVAKKAAAAAGDKYINFALNPECGGGSWWQSTIRASALPYGTEFDSYILEYKFKISDIVSSDNTKDRYVTLNMGNNALGIMPEEDAGKVHIYLTVPGSEIVNHHTTDAYLTTVAPDEWVEVKVHVYQEGAKVLTDVTANGNTKTGLDINKMNGAAYKYAAPTPQVQENAGHGPYFLQIDGISAAGSHKRGYNLAFDYVNLYAGDYTYEWDFADAYMSGNQIKWTGGDQGSNNFGAFTHSVVENTEVVNTALAAGYAAAVRDEFGGVSVIAKATGATEFGIIISPEVIETLTVADLANYYITNTESDSMTYAFKAYAQGTDGRFGVKVLGSEADSTYFAGRTTPLYVYVYAVNGDAVDFAAVNANGFLFN